MSAYRVKIITDNNGEQKFYPQHKFLFFWLNYMTIYDTDVVKNSFEEAESVIRAVNNSKIIKVEYKEIN